MSPDLNMQNNSEIEEALKEFEAKSVDTQPQAMTGASEVSDVSGIVRLVMKLSGGTIEEQKTAEYVVLGFVVLVVITSTILLFSSNKVAQPIKSITTPDVLS